MLTIFLALAASGADRVIAEGTAVKDDPCLKRRMVVCAPFESLEWVAEPDRKAISKAFSDPARAWLYAGFSCTGLTRGGALSDCRAPAGLPDKAVEVHARALRLLRAYRVDPIQSSRLRGKLDQIQMRLQIQFPGVSDWGNCGNYGFCTITPPPSPPPAKPQR